MHRPADKASDAWSLGGSHSETLVQGFLGVNRNTGERVYRYVTGRRLPDTVSGGGVCIGTTALHHGYIPHHGYCSISSNIIIPP